MPDFLPTGLPYAAVTAVATALQQPLAYLLTTPLGSLALLALPGEPQGLFSEQMLWLDGFKEDDLDSILYDQQGTWRYLHGTVLADTDILLGVLDEIIPMLRERLIAPLGQRLGCFGYKRAILIPTGTLGLLPLSALAPEEITFGLAPSARALQTALARRRGQEPATFLGIANPLPSPQPLAFAHIEVEEIVPLFAPERRQTLYERDATRAATLAASAGTTHLHLACHGRFNTEQPLGSALVLSGKDTLTLRDVLDGGLDLSAARLVALSACQTGITDFSKVPDEVVGFPAAFIQAGVPGIISTLWSVADVSTCLLLARFYRYHLSDKLPAAVALQQAHDWLREATAEGMGLARLYEQHYRESREPRSYQWMRYCKANPQVKPFAHPYYWAPFTYTGV